jgi:hypothetical protein
MLSFSCCDKFELAIKEVAFNDVTFEELIFDEVTFGKVAIDQISFCLRSNVDFFAETLAADCKLNVKVMRMIMSF